MTEKRKQSARARGPSRGRIDSEALRRLAVEALEELKAVDLEVLDVRRLTTVTDYMIIAGGRSDRQVKAIADNVVRRAKEHGCPPMGVEGERQGEWILVDLCDVVVHVMLPEVRAFYQLEKLWAAPPAAAERPAARGR